MTTRAVLSVWKGLVLLLPVILPTPPCTDVLADDHPDSLLAVVSLAVVITDARPTVVLAVSSSVIVFTDTCQSHCLHTLPSLWRLYSQMLAPQHCLHLLLTSSAVVLADSRAAVLLPPVSLEVVFAHVRTVALLTLASLAFVLADARVVTLLALAPYVVVRADDRAAALLALASDVVVLGDS
jgi:hypothetical protein